MSKSLYTKYRPQKFEDVIGQNVVKSILTNSITEDKINHAYLFFGIRGTGKTTLARIFAKSLNCVNAENFEPCGQCDSCKEITNGTSLDVIEIDAASNNGVDEIREIKEKTSYMTTTSKYKIYIIDEVHMLSKAAFNALLKTLEEPPQNTIFMLATTELNRIPETILSRTILLNLEELKVSNIVEGLKIILDKEQISYEEEGLEYIAKVSGGSMRDAISSLEASLLYSNEVSTDNILKSLGLININELKKMLNEDREALYKEIKTSDKDMRKTLNFLVEVSTQEVIEGNYSLIKILDDFVKILISIKDPSMIKLAILSAIAKNKTHVIVNEKTVETNIKLEEENQTKEANTEEIQLIETPTVEIKFADELIKRDKLKKQIDNEELVVRKEIENEVITDEISEEPEQETPEPTEETKVDVVDEEVVEPKKTISDYVTGSHYATILFEHNDLKRLKIVDRFKYIDTYQNNKVYGKYVNLLKETKVIAVNDQAIIIGVSDVDNYNKLKEASLDSDLNSFIEELTGEKLLLLPITPELWEKVRGMYTLAQKNNKRVSKPIEIEKINFYSSEETEEFKRIFGDKLI